MTSGIASKGVDLDSIFDPYVAGTTKARAAGIAAGGTDTSDLYANIIYGSAAAATGIQSEGDDLNTLYAKKGTASYALPIDGNTYTGANHLIAPNTGSAFISFTSTSSTWTIKGSLNFGTTTLASGAVPTGATKVKYTWGTYTVPFGSDGGGTVSNGAVSPTALSGSPTAQYTTATHGATGTFQRNYPFTIEFFNSSGQNISTTNITLVAVTDSSA